MEKMLIIVRVLNFILASLAVLYTTKVVFRTEKQLDKVFKFFNTSAIIVFVATFLDLDAIFNIIPHDIAKYVLLISRLLALVFFILAGKRMLRIIKEESCKSD